MLVKDVMTRKVISVQPQATLSQTIDVMMRWNVSGLPVVSEDGSLVGIISEGDLLRRPEIGTEGPRAGWLESLFRAGHAAEVYAHSHGRRVDEIMTTNVVTVREDDRLEDAARRMEKHGIKRLPVVRDDKIVGIISRADFVHVLAGFVRPAYEDQPVSDQTIKAAIEAELKAEPWAPADTVSVEVKDGVVDLNGVLTDEAQRNAVRIIAENTDGVTAVRDNLSWVEPITGFVAPPPGRNGEDPVAR
ncbi:CBS domain-containing protein [Labrys okinawensis]|uniref:CBS domain-containing protein n=1 Tax=Labrys okinawensis TaxID=346911 RepID=UPI0039BD6CD4